jgi:hypothetical protein
MTVDIDISELGPTAEALVDDLAENGGEIRVNRGGKTVARLVNANIASSEEASRADGLVLYKGEWMSAAGAERERSIEHLRGSGKILGDIVSPIDDVEWDALK